MRVLLVQPGHEEKFGFHCALGLVEPLGLEMVAGSLIGQHEVEILDLRLFPNTLEATVRDFKPQACGLTSTFTIDLHKTLELARQVKALAPQTFVFVGGHHASLNPAVFQDPAIDAIVIGEGELTAPALISCLEEKGELAKVAGLALNRPEGQIFTTPRPLIENLDALPYPVRHLVKAHSNRYCLALTCGLASMETTRSCPYRCRFCSVWQFYLKRVRMKSPARVVSELEKVEKKRVFFTDDNFFASVSRAKEIARLIRERGIKKRYTIQARSDTIATRPELISTWQEVGLSGVFIGFEKITPAELVSINKRNTIENNEKALAILRQHGIEPMVSFIIDPTYLAHDFARLREYVRRLRLRLPTFTVLTPLPGTELFEQVRDMLTITDSRYFDLLHSVLPTQLPVEEFYCEFASLWHTAYPGWLVLFGELYYTALNLLKRGNWSLNYVRKVVREVHKLADPGSYLREIQNFLEGTKRGTAVTR